MGKSSKKRERTDEDVADGHDAKPVVKKSKLDSTGKAEVTKKSSKVKEAEPDAVATEEVAKPKKEKKDKKEKKEKKDKKDKKRKSKDVETAAESDEPAPTPAPAAPSNPSPSTAEPANGADSADKKTKNKDKKDKKEKKDKKDKKSKPAPSTTTTTDDQTPSSEQQEDPTAETSSSSSKPTRFICFVGNLPYTATAESVRAHFATLQPTSVRLLTQRDDPSKSRGIAFVEFGRYDHMKTCLKKFHHTEFVDENDKKSKGPPRRINVELTAGGGGKTAARQDKIKQKNAKLNEERANRMQREEEAKYEKAAGAGAAGGGKTQEQRDEDAVHPSRRARVPYGKN
ncbi:hypothetical protein C8A01DRAFT_44833 [Parachaetomium inaequale]|uniref:RRM domain-containing protein n=1 Tax=Parachaetomium inaequale TaxID=2588326 RepID=A0AAN6STZ1_9PEZI|nr:hypothetical protein C8A01DRAFT_44833 [Parachaetomium inaequale]